MAASGWIGIIHYTYMHDTYIQGQRTNAYTIYNAIKNSQVIISKFGGSTQSFNLFIY